MDFESKPVIADAVKSSDVGVDMDGDGFKSHKPGAPGKENSQVHLSVLIYIYLSIILLFKVLTGLFAKPICFLIQYIM